MNQLVGGAPVDMADIPVGHVSAITLDGGRARVQMLLDRSAHVPSGVSAALEQTSVLGDYFVQLLPPSSASAGLLTERSDDRAHRGPPSDRATRPGGQPGLRIHLKHKELAEIIQAGGQGFGGRSANIRQLLNDLSDVTTGYAAHTAQIQSLINNLDQLSSGLAPSAARTRRRSRTCPRPSGCWHSSRTSSSTCSRR